VEAVVEEYIFRRFLGGLAAILGAKVGTIILDLTFGATVSTWLWQTFVQQNWLGSDRNRRNWLAPLSDHDLRPHECANRSRFAIEEQLGGQLVTEGARRKEAVSELNVKLDYLHRYVTEKVDRRITDLAEKQKEEDEYIANMALGKIEDTKASLAKIARPAIEPPSFLASPPPSQANLLVEAIENYQKKRS
jgi:hypothetical protein